MNNFTLENIQIFAAVLLPGLIAHKVWGRFFIRTKQEMSWIYMEILGFGLTNIFLQWLLLGDRLKTYFTTGPTYWWDKLDLALTVFLMPAILGAATYLLSTKLPKRRGADPTPTAWDKLFSLDRDVFVLCTLKSGKRVGGLFGPGSFASGYPDPQQMFISQTYTLTDDGDFGAKVEDTAGFLINASDCEAIQFFLPSPPAQATDEASSPEANDLQKASTKGREEDHEQQQQQANGASAPKPSEEPSAA